MAAYYNEVDPYCAAWLRNLIGAGHIAAGDVDERSIADVRADDLRSYTQCHFFAGIAGWSLALRMAGWPDTKPVWTGSCPCQGFSTAGQQRGFDDPRHLWPAWFKLIQECRPSIVFGEQVPNAIKLGWLDLVFDDLEGQDYACAAIVLPACSVGAPHLRQRLWFVADALSAGRPEWRTSAGDRQIAGSGGAGKLGIADGGRRAQGSSTASLNGHGYSALAAGWDASELGDASCDEQRQSRISETSDGRPGALGGSSPWSDLEWLPCTDGKSRPTKPGLFPLAHGISGRVGKLRAYGNAFVPQVAANFIQAACGN